MTPVNHPTSNLLYCKRISRVHSHILRTGSKRQGRVPRPTAVFMRDSPRIAGSGAIRQTFGAVAGGPIRF